MIDAELPTERIGLVVYRLALGKKTTTRQVANDYAISPEGARRMLEKLSRVLPLIHENGNWRMMGER